MKTHLLVTFFCFFFLGCDKGPNLADICQANSELCQEFTEDSWCKTERKATIFSAFAVKNNTTERLKYELLLAYEAYEKCVGVATKIEHIKLKEKRTLRVNNYLKAKERIKTISQETKNSVHPDLLFYHWSRYLDEKALTKFLKMEGSALLNTPQGQFNLATYYIKRDPNKTLSLLFHALELYQAKQALNTEIFKSLSTIFIDKKKPDQAYIWLKILLLYMPDNEEVSENSLTNFGEAYQLNRKFLNKVAKNTLDKIEQGKFEAPSS